MMNLDAEERGDRTPLFGDSRTSAGIAIVADQVCVGTKTGRSGQLRDVTLLLRSARIHCIVGANPIEASLLVRVLAGIENVTSGVVLGGGLPVVSARFRRCMGFVGRRSVCIPDAR